MPPVATVWDDLIAPLTLAVAGGGIAIFWPWLQTYWRGRKFEGIIRRELQELMPEPLTPQANTPWWAHLKKRFVHEEVFARERISANRDFLLSLDATVVYRVSQLWTAFDKRDAGQWLHFLEKLAHDERVGSNDLVNAHGAWCTLLTKTPPEAKSPPVREHRQPPSESLLEARLAAYRSLLLLTDYGSPELPAALTPDEREVRAHDLRRWFYEGGGLLLSSEAFVTWRLVQARLADPASGDATLRKLFSALRTELKIDLGVRDPDERDVEMASIGGDRPSASN
jgi:hypothetical protein